MVIVGKNIHYVRSQSVVDTCPDIDDLVITFVVCNETHVIVIHYFFNLVSCLLNQFSFRSRNVQIFQVERKTTFEGCLISQFFHIIQELCCTSHTRSLHNLTDDITQRFFSQQFIDKSHFLRNNLVEDHTTYSCL
ncbi:hypothetical protein D3C71_1186870 [compost metagenome]